MMKESFLRHFLSITDPRQEGKVYHPLMSIFFIAIAGYIANCDEWENIIDWAEHNIAWLKLFVDLPFGIPSESTFYRVFRLIKPIEFERRFIGWTQELVARHNSRSIAIDGKTLCGAKESDGEQSLFHIVSAWASDCGLTLGFLKTDEKSNEITAIPQLLELLSIEGNVVTIDAMGAQTKIVEQIVNEKKADYVLNLKSNQPSMYNDTVLFFTGVDNVCAKETDNSPDGIKAEKSDINAENNIKAAAGSIIQCYSGKEPEISMQAKFKDAISPPVFFEYDCQFHKTKEVGHGRIEQRYYFLVPEVSWLSRHEEWVSLKSVGMVISDVEKKKSGAKSLDCRFYLSSIMDVKEFANSVRNHWGCESAHWTLDFTFSEDKDLTHTEYSPENTAMFRRIARNLLKIEIDEFKKNNPKKKLSYQALRFRASIDVNVLEKIMIGNLPKG